MVSSLRIFGRGEPLTGGVPLPADELVLMSRLATSVLARGSTTILSRDAPEAALVLARGLSATLTDVTYGDGQFTVVGLGLGDGGRESGTLDVRGEAAAAAYLLALSAGRSREFRFLVDRVTAESLGQILTGLELVRIFDRGDHSEVVTVPVSEKFDGFEVSLSGSLPWLKGPLLLLALRAKTPSSLYEAVLSADHVERALMRLRAPIHVTGTAVNVHPPRDADALAPASYEEIGSLEGAAYLAALTCLVPGSRITTKAVCSNPSRSDFLTLLRMLGGGVEFFPRGDRQGEPYADVTFSTGTLRPAVLGGEQCVRLSDVAIPLLACFARSEGEFVIPGVLPGARDANPKFLSRAIGILKNAGVDAEVLPDQTARVRGTPAPLTPLRVTTGGDARLALLASVLALGASGESVIDNVDCLRHRFPRWIGTLRALGAQIVVEESA